LIALSKLIIENLLALKLNTIGIESEIRSRIFAPLNLKLPPLLQTLGVTVQPMQKNVGAQAQV
jgi:hypothetical protein